MPKGHGPERSRSEQARRIAWEVSERIAAATSPGLGKWALAWTIVAAASDDFTDTLLEWETSGTPNDLDNVRQKAESLVDAWRLADTKREISRLGGTPEKVA